MNKDGGWREMMIRIRLVWCGVTVNHSIGGLDVVDDQVSLGTL